MMNRQLNQPRIGGGTVGVLDMLGDVGRIRQVLRNLVSNSVESAERSSVVVSDDGGACTPVPMAPGRGVRILTAHTDSEPSRQVLDEQLTSLGVLHTSVTSAHEALTALRKARATDEPFDIVIVDAAMGMNGEALGRAIRVNHAMRHTALVLRGSAGDPADAKRLERAGFAAYLAKPASHSQLVDTLMTALGAACVTPSTTTVKNESRDAPLRLRLVR